MGVINQKKSGEHPKKNQDRCYSRKISSQSACDVLWFLQIPILTYHFAPSKQTSGLVPIVSFYTTYLIHVTLEGTDFSLWKKEGYAQDKEGFFYLSIFEIWDNLRKKNISMCKEKSTITYLLTTRMSIM